MADDLELRELVAALKHDLAKYVAWRSANYDDAAWQGTMQPEFVAALQDDLLRTKGQLAAWQVWDRAAADLGDLSVHPQLRAVDEAVDVLRGLEAAVREGKGALAAARGDIRAAQQTIRSQLRDLHRTLARG